MKKATYKKFFQDYHKFTNLLELDENNNPKHISVDEYNLIKSLFDFETPLQFSAFLSHYTGNLIVDANSFRPCYYSSLRASGAGIDNFPKDVYLYNNIALSSRLLCLIVSRFVDWFNEVEKPSKIKGSDIVCTSGYRCKKLNSLVGGSVTSLHKEGLAYDLVFPCPGCRASFLKFINEVFLPDIIESNDCNNSPILVPHELIVYNYDLNRIHIGFKYLIMSKL